MSCSERCLKLREKLLKTTSTQSIENGFWNVSDKARFDIIMEDIPRLQFHIKFSIKKIDELIPLVSSAKVGEVYRPVINDAIFWYYMDHCIRSISSGWDRLSILLDMAFGTNLKKNCNIHKVLTEIEKKNMGFTTQYFKKLQNIQQNGLQLLESSKGKGLRNESAHSMTLGTKFFFEFLEKAHLQLSNRPTLTRKEIIKEYNDWIGDIKRLSDDLKNGIELTFNLIENEVK